MTAVRDQSVGAYVEAVASTSAVPGGGSAAALAASMAAALVSMVAKLSARRLTEGEQRESLNRAVPELEHLASRLLDLSQEDIDAYRAVIEARKAKRDGADLERAYERAAEVPLATAMAADRALSLATEVSRNAWEMVASDLSTANRLLQAGLDGALANVAINLPELKGEAASRIEQRYRELLR
ncbi:MAG TPA: cyclodeaminase/cyclohydrolase family protein [Candidatus Dormibacteraeota bacterium]|nr:cyclodeaminase/cyclohydrolase family protein [Candidatus Dormibacteraeota bacterium]